MANTEPPPKAMRAPVIVPATRPRRRPGARVLAAGWVAILAAVILAALPLGAAAQQRTALVIGNGAYAASPLANAVNDASDMADALTRAGFEVILATDADQRAMDEALDQFAGALAAHRGIGMFYYSGHGVQVDDANYLLPVGAEITHERDVKYAAFNASRAIEAMQASGAALSIVVLDACRNNPLQAGGRSATRGLSRVSTGGTGASGLFVSFSTAPGAVALDGDSRNSPYTGHLLGAIATPGLSLEDVFKQALRGVHNDTGGEQVPWISSSFFGDFVFTASGEQIAAGQTVPSTAAPAAQAATRAEPAPQLVKLVTREAPPAAHDGVQGLYAANGVNPNGTTYTGMTSVASLGGERYRFDWWIGAQRFTGTGQRDGRWIRVDWGANAPVIYTLASDGRLDGIWADGRASEVLTLHALAAPGPTPPIGGHYEASGGNPNGTSYSGTATIEPAGGQWRINWSVGGSAYQGVGTAEGSLLTVDWGDSNPVVYVVRKDGSLTGLWSSGRGFEVLTPAR